MLVLAASLAALPGTAAAQQTALEPAELVLRATELDGRLVTLQGEAIGDILHAGPDDVWVNLGADGVGVGVFVDGILADRISSLGDYRRSGDIAMVQGRFNAACDRHGGDLDLHATSLVILESGQPTVHAVDYWRGIAGAALLGMALLLQRIYKSRRLRTTDAG